MPRTCTVCASPECREIDKELVGANVSYRDIARRFRVTKDALYRHKCEHLPALLVRAKEADEVGHAVDVVAQLRAINHACNLLLTEALQRRDDDTALRACDRLLKQIELQAKLLGELSDASQINLSLDVRWVSARTALLLALAGYPDARRAAARALEASGL
jgi:hypothetical protein